MRRRCDSAHGRRGRARARGRGSPALPRPPQEQRVRVVCWMRAQAKGVGGAVVVVGMVTAVGFEPTPLRTGACSQRLRPLGQTVMTATRRWGHMSQARRGRETLPSPTPPHTALPCCCSRLRRTIMGLEPTIFGIVLRRLVHQAKDALNAIRPPRALNTHPWQLRLFGSQALGLLGRAKPRTPPPPGRGEEGGGRGMASAAGN